MAWAVPTTHSLTCGKAERGGPKFCPISPNLPPKRDPLLIPINSFPFNFIHNPPTVIPHPPPKTTPCHPRCPPTLLAKRRELRDSEKFSSRGEMLTNISLGVWGGHKMSVG